MFKRYVWGEWATSASHDKDPKAVPAEANDDFPALAQYMANSNPTFTNLHYGVKRNVPKGRKHAY